MTIFGGPAPRPEREPPSVTEDVLPVEDAPPLSSGAVPTRARSTRALKHRSFLVLWGSLQVGQLGFWVSHIALQWLMITLTSSDPIWLGLLFFANFIPLLIVSPFSGALADRVDRKRLLITAQLLVAGVASILASVAMFGSPTPEAVLVLAFCLGTAMALGAPASQAVVANAVPPEDLSSAISLQSVGINLSRVAGPALATPVLALWGPGPAIAAYAGSSLFVAVALITIRVAPYTPEADAGSVWRRMRSGLAHVRERPPGLLALAAMGVQSVFGIAYLAMLPVIATTVLGRGEVGFALLAAATGVGATTGAVIMGRQANAPGIRSIGAGLGAFGLAAGLFALSGSFPLSMVLVAVTGGFHFWTVTALNTLLQALTDEDKRARVMSLFIVTWGGLAPIGGLYAGTLARFVGSGWAVFANGLVCVAFGLVVAVRKQG